MGEGGIAIVVAAATPAPPPSATPLRAFLPGAQMLYVATDHRDKGAVKRAFAKHGVKTVVVPERAPKSYSAIFSSFVSTFNFAGATASLRSNLGCVQSHLLSRVLARREPIAGEGVRCCAQNTGTCYSRDGEGIGEAASRRRLVLQCHVKIVHLETERREQCHVQIVRLETERRERGVAEHDTSPLE